MRHLGGPDGAPGAALRPGASAPCPLCYAPVSARELRRAEMSVEREPRAGRPLTLVLMRRPRRGADADAPRRASPAAAPTLNGVCDDRAAHRRTLRVTPAEAAEFWAADARALANEAAELARSAEWSPVASDSVPPQSVVEARLAGPWCHLAAETLALRARAWTERRYAALARRPGHAATAANASASAARDACDAALAAFEGEFRRLRSAESFPDLPVAPTVASAAKEAAPMPSVAPADPAGPADDSWVYYYQCPRGRPIFLTPLGFRVLSSSVDGILSRLPAWIRCPLAEVEPEQRVDPGARRRIGCLAGLPLGGTFRLVEADLSGEGARFGPPAAEAASGDASDALAPPAGLAAALAEHATELAARARARRSAAAADRREDARIRAADDSERRARTAAGPNEAELRAMPALPSSSLGIQTADAAGDHNTPPAAVSPPCSGPSFSRMAALGLAASGDDGAGGGGNGLSLVELYGRKEVRGGGGGSAYRPSGWVALGGGGGAARATGVGLAVKDTPAAAPAPRRKGGRGTPLDWGA